MSTLRSFSFGLFNGFDEIPNEVLSLFQDLVKDPSKKIEFASEVVASGMQGRIDFERRFNLDGFEAAIRKNTHLIKERRKRKELSVIDYGIEGEDGIEVGCISEASMTNSMLDKVVDAYEEVIADNELYYAVSTIQSLNEEILVEEGIDFIRALKQAVKGIPAAVNAVKEVCSNYTIISELVHDILDSGIPVEELFC